MEIDTLKTRTLSEIWIYPIKSLGGIRLVQSKILKKGLYLDRRWMLIDYKNTFITQRSHYTMALFKLSLTADHLVIRFQNETLQLPVAAPLNNKPIEATIWSDQVTVYEVAGEFSAWFTERLNVNCRLVFFPEDNSRPVDPRYAVGQDHVGLADGYPFLMIGQCSLEDLNTRLAEPVPMNRFRPNFVFTGGQPYEEETWKNFSIGTNRFVGVKPCSRCVLTTVNQDTGEKGREPLATLAKYKKVGNKILFGQNIVALDYDEIKEGDEIQLET